MSRYAKQIARPENRLLAAVPSKTYKRLLPNLEVVALNQGDVLCEPDEFFDYVYFPNDGMITLVSTTENGMTMEVGIIGSEGMIGVPILLGAKTTPYRPTVQIPGSAIRMKVSSLK